MTDPGTCAAFDVDLSALLDGELEPAREAAVRSHTVGCARCADRLARLARVDEVLHSFPGAETPGDFAERLRLRLEEERRRSATTAEDRGRSFQEARGGADDRGRPSEGRSPQPTQRPLPRRRRWIPVAATALAAAAALALYLLFARPRPAGEPTLAEHERTAGSPEVAVREVPTPVPDELVSGPELEAIQAASDDELAVALDLDTLADFDVIERLDVLEQLAALDGAG